MSQSRKRKRLGSRNQSTESSSLASNGERTENLLNVISHWKQENATEYQAAVSTTHKLSTREQLVYSTPWMKALLLEILAYPGFYEEIVRSSYLRLLANICSDPLREV